MTDTQYTPTAHSNVVGGSSAARVLACPASVKLIQTMPPQAESSYAAEGTALHNAIEHCLYEGLELEGVQELAGEEFYGIKLTADMVEGGLVPAWQMFWDYVDRIEAEDESEFIFAVEQSVHFPGIGDAFGTADIIGHTSKRSVVWDWKFGKGVVVSAKENKQQMYYACGSSNTAQAPFLPKSIGEWENAPDDWAVDLIIAQPFIHEEPSVWTTNPVQLEDFEIKLQGAVTEALEAEDPRVARGDHCRWCTASPICPMYRQVGERLAALVNGEREPGTVQEVAEADMTEVEGPEPEVLAKAITPDLLAEWLLKADIVELWANSVRGLAMSEAEAGRPPAGLKLVEKVGNLAYTSPATADKMLGNKGLTAVERRKIAPITPTQANALLKKKGKKLLTDRQALRPKTGVVLAPLDDKRPAVKTVADKAAAVAEKLLHEPD